MVDFYPKYGPLPSVRSLLNSQCWKAAAGSVPFSLLNRAQKFGDGLLIW